MISVLSKLVDIFVEEDKGHEWVENGEWKVPGPRPGNRKVHSYICENEGCHLEKDEGELLSPPVQYFLHEERMEEAPRCPVND